MSVIAATISRGAGIASPAPRNWLLQSANFRAGSRLDVSLESVTLVRDQVLHTAGQPVSHVYFPFDAVLSVTQGLPGEREIEVASIGCEGVGGLCAAFGTTEAVGGCVVRIPGRAARLSVDDFRTLLSEDLGFAMALRRYTAALVSHLGQSSVCYATHSVEQQCARWLLLARDRVESGDLPITHESLADALAARRASITVALGTLRRDRIIDYRRSRITILEPAALIQRSCGCYGAIVAALRSIYPGWGSTSLETVRVAAAHTRP